MFTKLSVIYSALSGFIIAAGVAIHLGATDDVTGVMPLAFPVAALGF